MTRVAATHRTAASHRAPVSNRLVRSLLLLMQPDGATAKDTRVDKANPTTNSGTGTTCALVGNGAASPVYGLLDWDLSALAVDDTILSATLGMFVSAFNGSTRLFNIYEMIANSDWTEAGATWNTKDGTNAWAGGVNGGGVDGVDINATPIGSATYTANTPNGAVVLFPLTPSRVAAHAGGRLNLVIKRIDSATGAGPTLRLSDSTVAAERPFLLIRYKHASSGAPGQEFLPTPLALDTTTTDDTSLLVNPLTNAFGSKYTGADASFPLSEQPLTTGNDRNGATEELISWAAIERYSTPIRSGTSVTSGDYDWTPITNHLAAQGGVGRRTHFRIRAMLSTDATLAETMIPQNLRMAPYAVQQPNGAWIPDFNNPVVLDRICAFIAEFGRLFKANNDIWGIDAGFMGKFGEWVQPLNNAALGFSDMLPASIIRVVQAYMTAFAGSQIWIILHSIDRFQEVLWTILPIADASGCKIGLRSDGYFNAVTSAQLGAVFYHPTYTAGAPPGYSELASNWWQSHVVIAESWVQVADGVSPTGSQQSQTTNGFRYGLKQATGGSGQVGFSTFGHPELTSRNLRVTALAVHNIRSRNAGNTADANWFGAGAFAYTTEDQRVLYEVVKRLGYRYRISAVRVQDAVAGGTATIEIDWLNEGNTPIYFPFAVNLYLFSGSAQISTATMAGTDLRTILPTNGIPVTKSGPLSLAAVTGGTYTLYVDLPDADPRGGKYRSLRLAQAGRQADGKHLIGSVVVVQ